MNVIEDRECVSVEEDQGVGMKEGWPVVPLGELCDVVGGGTPSKENHSFYLGDIPWATVRDMRQDLITETEFYITEDAVRNSSTNIISSGNVVIATRVGLGKVCLLGQDTAINQDLRGIVPRNLENLAVRYLYWWLKSVSSLIVAEGTGATVQGVKLPFVKSLPVPLPPLPEQQRIVALLDEAFAGLATAKANAERNLQNARALFESHLQSVFSQRGEGWVEKPLGDVCELFQGLCINAKTKHLLVETSSLPLLRIKDSRSNSSEQYIAESGWPKNAKVSVDELIYTRTGQIGLVFRGRVVVLHNNCFKVRPKPMLNSDYLFWWLQSPEFRARITTLASKAAQPDITHSLFKVQPIDIPPRDYQDNAIAVIDKMCYETQRLTHLYERKLAALEELKKSLLHQAFNGEL